MISDNFLWCDDDEIAKRSKVVGKGINKKVMIVSLGRKLWYDNVNIILIWFNS